MLCSVFGYSQRGPSGKCTISCSTILYLTCYASDFISSSFRNSTDLSQFSSIFTEPSSLPPARPCDHQIHLTPGSKPINLRPYRFSYSQKLELESILKELLKNNFIQPSSSSFASPVLLVKKKDGTWHMCIDYRKLNDNTIKNKFPIPIINDLLDELYGASIFSKIDLRSGYHQIRMHKDHIPLTAFRTHDGLFEFTVMPFGLTNAPVTFQSLMNSIFKPFLRKFFVIFFDDILVYSKDYVTHLHHLTLTLQLLLDNNLHAKLTKCTFATTSIDYLGHIISPEGVSTDLSKIQAMVNWPTPTSVKALRGFLGLTGYYRKFIKKYGLISKSLTELLKKDSFKWSTTAQQAFDTLKAAMTNAPVLTLPDFTQLFTIETDASQFGIGAVLMQHRKPIAYLSKKLGIKNQGLFTYEKFLLALITAVTKWKHYLIGNEFVIKTDQISLKHLLEQKANTALQHRGLSKLLGLHYRIEYKKGVDNKVADALSRCDHVTDDILSLTPSLTAFSELVPQWVTDITSSYHEDTWISSLLQKFHALGSDKTHLTLHQGVLRYKGRICVGNTNNWRTQLLQELHDSAQGGHSGIDVTYHRLCQLFYWPHMKEDVIAYVTFCNNCQMTKSDHTHPPGLLQPLPVPDTPWASVGIDFNTGLPTSEGRNVIMVVVDRFTKFAHFTPLSHPYSAIDVAKTFFTHVYTIHGLPSSIVSYPGPIFTCHFWTAWLPLTQWWYNSTYHRSLQTSPFQALFGYPPPQLPLGHPPRSQIEAIDSLRDRHRTFTQLKANLLKAQDRMKKIADQHRLELNYSVGDWVYLKLQSYRQISIYKGKNQKLAPRYYGPFEIDQRVGSVAYRLRLPSGSAIHPVIHVSQLKKHVARGQPISPSSPILSPAGQLLIYPEYIISRRAIQRHNVAVPQLLVKWSNLTEEDASWEDYDTLRAR
jgi:RNase H-like domain found in reverse transcriptase/Reverse transcriptase (RNA-dependent DNA polymerase)/Integrase zinc binding domain